MRQEIIRKAQKLIKISLLFFLQFILHIRQTLVQLVKKTKQQQQQQQKKNRETI